MWVEVAWLAALAGTLAGVVRAGVAGAPYVFLRQARGAAGARRVSGGERARLDAARVLQDRWGAALCSGVEIRECWVLTAAHCVEPRVARAGAASGDSAAVLARYRHPEYSVRQERGDVVALSHDVGLLLTERALPGTARPSWRRAASVAGRDAVLLYGFGESAGGGAGSALRAARVSPRDCPRGTWVHCWCAMGDYADGEGAACAGDSGGPAVRDGRVVAVASLGPLQCATPALTVLTELAPYRRLVRATMSDRKHMKEVSPPASPDSRAARSTTTALVLVVSIHTQMS